MSTVFIVVSCLIALPGVGTALHLGFIATASIFYRVPRGAHPAAVHFLVLVPAYNEELVIANTLQAVFADLRVGDQVLVIADRCTDATASIARSQGSSLGLAFLPPGFCCRYNRFFALVQPAQEMGSSRGLAAP